MRPCPFPTNQMQISINSINGQCLLVVKIAQRLLVSGSKMDDQWPWRSQRSKMTITLKCNLCWPPALGLVGGAGHLQPPARPGCSQPSSQAGGLGAPWAVPSVCPHAQPWACAAVPPAERTHTSTHCCPPRSPMVAAKMRTAFCFHQANPHLLQL